MRFLILLFAISGAVHSQVVLAQAPENILFSSCSQMRVLVEGLSEKATDIGLTEEIIEDAAEARIRSARLYLSGIEEDREFTGEELSALFFAQLLYINVNVVGPAFSIAVELNRFVEDTGFGYSGYVTVWDTGSTGTHGGNSSYLVGIISQLLDKFLNECLSANADACGGPG